MKPAAFSHCIFEILKKCGNSRVMELKGNGKTNKGGIL